MNFLQEAVLDQAQATKASEIQLQVKSRRKHANMLTNIETFQACE